MKHERDDDGGGARPLDVARLRSELHELNNYLTVIGGYATLVGRRLPSDSPEQEGIDHIRTATKGASEVLRRMFSDLHPSSLPPGTGSP